MSRYTALTTLAVLAGTSFAQTPFQFEVPGYDADRFRITTFATGLNYPVGMVEFEDGSIGVLTSNGSSFFGSSSGSILKLTDTNGDGISDQSETLTNQVPGGKMSSLRRAGDLLFATGQGTSMSIFEIADAGLSQIAELDMRYSGSWLHPHSALAVQHNGENYSLYFQLGSDRNFDTTTRTVTLNADFGLTAELAGDALHRLDFVYSNQDGFSNSSVTQIATGLRNAAGMAFHPLTGDLYLEDNGIDGVQNPNEPTSADEINVIPLGTDSIVDFGFPHSYVEYRTGNLIGNADLAPLVAFLPLPNPADGAEAEGPNDISFGPANFPLPLHSGLFVGMHGKFSLGGTSNEKRIRWCLLIYETIPIRM